MRSNAIAMNLRNLATLVPLHSPSRKVQWLVRRHIRESLFDAGFERFPNLPVVGTGRIKSYSLR